MQLTRAGAAGRTAAALYIGGKWIDGPAHLEVRNPARLAERPYADRVPALRGDRIDRALEQPGDPCVKPDRVGIIRRKRRRGETARIGAAGVDREHRSLCERIAARAGQRRHGLAGRDRRRTAT
jgi:hypothetical protein